MSERQTGGKLGFGLMRLPRKGDGYDIEQCKEMVDLFLASGMTYFDTAYVYDDGESEKAVRTLLTERYPREKFELATKLSAWYGPQDLETVRSQFQISLERTGAGYFDAYLCHCLSSRKLAPFDQFAIWDFVREQQAKGLIKRWGFSYHDGPELLDQILTDHPDVDFVQLQLNYADWEDPRVQSRANYEVARKHGKDIVVMEPVKGGALANPHPSIRKVLEAADPNASCASWAVRFVASLEGVRTVLSGMSSTEQVRDNVSYMKHFQPLTEAEQQVIRDAQKALSEVDSIRCTGCKYCVAGCPKHVPIPQIFAARNKELIWNQQDKARNTYLEIKENGPTAKDCIGCGRCEQTCPQHLDVIQKLRECAAAYEPEEA